MTETPRPPRELQPGLPENVERAVLRSLEKDPAQRFRRVEDFVGELGGQVTSAMAAQPTPASTPAVSAPTAVHVSATDTIGAAAGETVMGVPPPRRTSPVFIAVPAVLVIGGAAFFFSRAPKPAGGAISGSAMVQPEAPKVVPPPAAPPPIKQAKQAARAKLAVRATPPEAEILVDGRSVGNPYAEDVELDGKSYDVEIRAAGYVTHHQKVSLDQAPEPVAVALTAEPTKSTPPSEHGKGKGKHHGVRLPGAPPSEADPSPAKPEAKFDTKPSEKAEKTAERAEKPNGKPNGKIEGKPADDGPTIYKGTRGKLMTDDPFAK